MDVLVIAFTAFLCLGLGGTIGWLLARARASTETVRLQATLDAAQAGERRLEQSLRALTHDAISENNLTFARLIAPLQDSLAKVEHQVSGVERDRVDAYAALREQVVAMRQNSEQLRIETSQLVSALRAPQVRGRWGEHQLRRIIEVAGMVEHCDFLEQPTSTNSDGTLRPDLVVKLAGGKNIVVDSKVPFAAYLEAMEARDERTRNARMDAHARHLRSHVDALGSKAYWERFAPSPEFVVLFVPADTFLDAALQRDASLLEHAFGRNVVIATPSTLIAMLRTIAYTWRQEALADNAAKVHALGRELHSRLSTMGTHFGKVGSALNSAVTRYNEAIGSLEGRVLVTARKFVDLSVTTDELCTPPQVEIVSRQLQAPELVASANESLISLDERQAALDAARLAGATTPPRSRPETG